MASLQKLLPYKNRRAHCPAVFVSYNPIIPVPYDREICRSDQSSYPPELKQLPVQDPICAEGKCYQGHDASGFRDATL